VQPAPKGARSVVGSCSEDKVSGEEKAEEAVGEASGGSGERSEAGSSEVMKPVREGSVLDDYLMEPGTTGVGESGGDGIEENLAGSGSRVLLTTRRRRSRSRSVNRRSAPARVLTHDEVCEDLRRVIEEDEPIGLVERRSCSRSLLSLISMILISEINELYQ